MSEPAVFWPELKSPVVTTRALSIVSGSSDGVTRISAIELIILVNGCLYVVKNDGFGLRAGDILSRNLDLTRRKGSDPTRQEEQVFIRYQSIYAARRGIGRVYGRYKAIELPELSRWRIDADWLLRRSWTLSRNDPTGDEQFVWRADGRIRQHLGDKAANKVAALTRFMKIATLTDALGRRNTPALALQCSAADRSLEARAQEVRGIGRRMDWRGIVLEHFVDELRSECRVIRRAAQDAFTAKDLFGAERTSKALRVRARRMIEYAEILRGLHVRTFDRVFDHVARELDEASGLLSEAAGKHDATPLDRVRALLGKIYRSMMLVDEHWRLEEILDVVAEHHHRNQPLSDDQKRVFIEELVSVHHALTTEDSLTKQMIGEGFELNVLPVVIGNVVLARTELTNVAGVKPRQLYEFLKRACEPL